MRKSLVSAFSAASSYSSAIALSKEIAAVKDFSTDEKAAIERASKENDQVFHGNGVVTRVCAAIGIRDPRKAAEVDDVPF